VSQTKVHQRRSELARKCPGRDNQLAVFRSDEAQKRQRQCGTTKQEDQIFSKHACKLAASWVLAPEEPPTPAQRNAIIQPAERVAQCRQRPVDNRGELLEKFLDPEKLLQTVRKLKRDGRTIVFTNGCFDILHPGHIGYLRTARSLGDVLIVGLNSDRSVQILKGNLRPILNQQERCVLVSGLESVSYVTVFEEETPLNLIKAILPDILVKGGDWGIGEIVGRDEVEAQGGKVVSLPYETGQSTSGIIERILKRYQPANESQ
jgi:D-beta-D-heptose 7-phosphate kinase/D-beta-D-heptose 1-phosphate adenosyltransferase